MLMTFPFRQQSNPTLNPSLDPPSDEKATIQLFSLDSKDEEEAGRAKSLLPTVKTLADKLKGINLPEEVADSLKQNLAQTQEHTSAIDNVNNPSDPTSSELDTEGVAALEELFGKRPEDEGVSFKFICSCYTVDNIERIDTVGILAITKNVSSAIINCQQLGQDSHLGREIGKIVMSQASCGPSTEKILFFDPIGAKSSSVSVAIGTAWHGNANSRENEWECFLQGAEILTLYKDK